VTGGGGTDVDLADADWAAAVGAHAPIAAAKLAPAMTARFDADRFKSLIIFPPPDVIPPPQSYIMLAEVCFSVTIY
jgi:hypothetical protein